MKRLSGVVWSEGMYLGPHHFQAQNNYFEQALQFATSALWFEPYGLLAYELQAEALADGTVSLTHARGTFPDGLPFCMPEVDPVPPRRTITDLFPPTRESLTVVLAIPSWKSDGLNCVISETQPQENTRYVAEEYRLPDENTGRDEKPVRLGRKNIQFLLDCENSEGFVTLALARIKRDGAGHFIYDPDFIPPCVQIGASETLMMMVRRLIDILEEKSSALSRTGQPVAKFSAGLSAREVASFWYLHSINASLAPLRHLCFSKRGHPEELFVELSRLAGALCTFGLDSHPRSLPLYDHLNLERCFKDLDRHIRAHLEIVVPTSCVAIPLRPAEPSFYDGEIIDQRCLDRARWVLAIHSDVGEVELVSKAAKLVKVCSSPFVRELVKRALPGLTLTHMPVPPAAVPAKVERQYFSIDRSGPCWEHIVKTRGVGIYVPSELSNPEVELLVLLEM